MGEECAAQTAGACAERTAVNVLLCVTGSVAGVKTGELATKLQAAGAAVKLAATGAGAVFIDRTQQPLPQGVQVLRDDDRELAVCNCAYPCHNCARGAHAVTSSECGASSRCSTCMQVCEERYVQLVEWADTAVVAPLSANSLAKLSMGLCDNVVTSVARCWPMRERPLLLAPAMNTKMWEHPATRQQLAALEAMGARVLAPVSKRLACGDVGTGAMAGVDDIVAAVLQSARAGDNGAAAGS